MLHPISLAPGSDAHPGRLGAPCSEVAGVAREPDPEGARAAALEPQIAALQDALAAERGRAQELFELVPDPYVITDDAGIVRECNSAAAELFRVPKRALAGKSLASLMDPETRAEFRARVGQLRAGGAMRWRGQLRPREGVLIPIVISAAPMRDGARLAGFRWMLRDDSEQHAAQARLFELSEELAARREAPYGGSGPADALPPRPADDRRRGGGLAPRFVDLLGVISHEIRTPVAAANGYIEMLRRGLHGEVTAQQRRDLDSVGACHEHLLRILDNALTVARLDNGHLDLTLAPVPVDATLAALDAYIEPALLARGVRYAYRRGDPSVRVLVDRAKLHQIMLNLLGNAVKYTPGGGSVTLSWHTTEADVSIAVVDTGVGIAPEDRERIFEPYVRLAANGTCGRGTGLGLAISRRLARAMGGDVTVAVGSRIGSTFTLTLPRAARSAP